MGPYRPLDSSGGEIRLLEIRPATKYAAPIVCKLRHAYLSKAPKYECLSYVWGKEEGGTDIKLEGTSFRVFENCEAALRRLRNLATSRTVWIDAICINQTDNDEKGAQVRRMRDIYQHAQQVCIWLGELTDGSIVGVKSIQGKLTMGWHMWQVDRKFGKPTLPAGESFKGSISLQNRSNLIQEQELGEVNEILDRPWFTRVWIMQEAVLARKLVLMCGPETMAWDRDRPAVAYSLLEQARYHDIYALITDGPQHPPRRGWAKLPGGWERIQEEGKPCYFRNHNDGTNHDQSPLEGGEPIAARYYVDQRVLPRAWTKTWNNLGQAQVSFTPSTLAVDSQSERLKHLKKHNLDKLPSWVPNWEARTAHDPAPILDWSDPLPRYWASGKLSTARTMAATDPNILGLEGFIFDVVETMACPWHPKSKIGPFSRKGIEELETWEALAAVEVQECPYDKMGGRKNALWRTLIADWAGDRAAPEEDWLLVETWYDRIGWQPEMPDLTSKGIWETANLEQRAQDMEPAMAAHFSSLRAATPAYVDFVGSASVTRITKDAVSVGLKLPKRYGEYVRRIRRACAHRAMFVTRRGYLGLAPWNAQDGDLVCVLRGGKTPFLLRLPPAGSVYQIVGEAYVHGIMGGEAVENEDGIDWRVFNLG
ncbi:hypothetical protein LLEC1_06366 [Akanthomyces lecanii]|uniref:Heterokaryon incompatibility domain-containing protein n=1 Tax=Cordyceps confragosa TaxID=2714763 RepID=A0A179I5J3_CORDF|nr:hypothetical protein LLEC1_06366 [Akanthomyces lecanii]